jgi:uncharacterized protein YegL
MRLLPRLEIVILYWLYFWWPVYSACLSSLEGDLVFVVDASYSIWTAEWKGMLDFINKLVSNSLPQGTRVGAVVFGSQVSTVFGLEQYNNLDDIGDAVLKIPRLGGSTNTKGALAEAHDVFQDAWDEERSKKILLITDGNPNANPCEISANLKADGISVINVVVRGHWYDKTNMDCLVNDVDKDVIPIESFDLLENSIGTVEEVLCSSDLELNVIEVQPYSDSARFIEIYNMGGDIDLYGVELLGMYTGSISKSTKVSQGDMVLISEDSSLKSKCVNKCVFYDWTGSTDDYESPENDGSVNEGFSLSISHGGEIIHSVSWTENDNFPKVAHGRSFELNLPASNNNLGSNWRSSCDIGGSPGEFPGDECPGCKSNADCQFQGDEDASCDLISRTCTCSLGYYNLGSTCEPLPAPSNCIAQEVSGYNNRYTLNWNQPNFVDSLAFMRIEIMFTLSGHHTESILEYLSAPPTSGFAIEEEYISKVTIAAVFNKTDVSYKTEWILCIARYAPTKSPSGAPSYVPTEIPSDNPTLSPVPSVTSCELRIAGNTKTEAEISWVWNGGYTVGGVATDPTAFVLKWGERIPNYFTSVKNGNSNAEISLTASWDYSLVVSTVTVQGYEDGWLVLSDSVECSVVQATASPVNYPVPAPDACVLDVDVGGKKGVVTVTPPSSSYSIANVSLGYLVRIVTTSYTEYNLGYNGTLDQDVIIPPSSYDVYAVSLGTEGGIHPESDQVECSVISPSPTISPTPVEPQYIVPTLSSCKVSVNSGEKNGYFLVTISWVKGSQYEHDGVPKNLYGYKYKLGGRTIWDTVEEDAITNVDVYWNITYANSRLITYMVAVGQEMKNGAMLYPDSSAIPCDLLTMDPTISPTVRPSRMPTRSPTSVPTAGPTFELPEVAFVPTNLKTGDALYNCMEGSDGIEIQIKQSPVSLYPITVFWEILDYNGESVVDVFNETSGSLSFTDFRKNYKTECSEPDGSCIREYSCLSHMGYDYCVKDVEQVYEKIYLSSLDDGIVNEAPEYFWVVLRSSDFVGNNEFYKNTSQNIINSHSSNATVVVFDAASKEFCVASPDSLLCLGGKKLALLWWHYLIIAILIVALITAVFCYRYESTTADLAVRKKMLAEEALSNEVLLGEEGFGPGMSSHVNPLALSSPKRKKHTLRVTPTVSDESDENGQIEMEGFSEQQKTQFIPKALKKRKPKEDDQANIDEFNILI